MSSCGAAAPLYEPWQLTQCAGVVSRTRVGYDTRAQRRGRPLRPRTVDSRKDRVSDGGLLEDRLKIG
jgi:hypothetical protein